MPAHQYTAGVWERQLICTSIHCRLFEKDTGCTCTSIHCRCLRKTQVTPAHQDTVDISERHRLHQYINTLQVFEKDTGHTCTSRHYRYLRKTRVINTLQVFEKDTAYLYINILQVFERQVAPVHQYNAGVWERHKQSLPVTQYAAGVWERHKQNLPVHQYTAGVCTVTGCPEQSVHSGSSSGVSGWHRLPEGTGHGQVIHTAPPLSPVMFDSDKT